MAIKGITYDNQGPSAAAHAEFFASTHLDGILNGCALSYLGDTLTIAAGRIVSAGRLSELQAAETITVSAASGVARVLLQTDLSQEATRTSFKQLSFVVQTAASVAALPALVQEDINSGSGVIFQSEICTLQLGSSGIEAILSQMPRSVPCTQYSPIVGVPLASAQYHDITAADVGKTIYFGWTSGESEIDTSLSLSLENSRTMPIGAEIAILYYHGKSCVLTASGGIYLDVADESRALNRSVAVTGKYQMIAIKKIISNATNDYWLVTGPVEVVA